MADLNIYLIMATRDWCIDSDNTPYLLVNTQLIGSHNIPKSYINEDGTIILNVSNRSASNIKINGDNIELSISFNSIPIFIVIPVYSILAIYSKETGTGLTFNLELQEYKSEIKVVSDSTPIQKKDNVVSLSNFKKNKEVKQ